MTRPVKGAAVPAPPPNPPVLTLAVAQAAPASKHRVLLIHESRTTRDTLEKSMRGRFDVRIARNAEEAWQAVLIDQSIRAIVASLPVLEIDGYGVLQRIRRSKVSRIAGTPVVIVADGEDHALGKVATSFGASDVTPFADLDGLRDRLQALIEPGTLVQTDRPAEVLSALRTNLLANDKPAGAPAISPPPATPPAAPPAPPVRAAAQAPPASIAPPAQPAAPAKTTTTTTTTTESSMSRLDSLNKVLKTLQSSSPGVEASALISSDGLMIASALAQGMDETRIAAMTATLLNLGTRAATELRRGEVSEVIVRGDQGYAVMISAGRGALLLVLATEATPLGLIFFDMREAAKGIKTVL